MVDLLLPPEVINLAGLNVSYTGSADKNSSQEESDKVLQQISVGLIMHLASDSKFAVGTTMKSVLSTQQAIISDNDELNDVILICQLHGKINQIRKQQPFINKLWLKVLNPISS